VVFLLEETVFTAFFTLARLTGPDFGAECTLRAVADFFASVFAAADFALELLEVLRVFPALLACVLVGAFLVAMN
tara:strand:- start:3532 stop:3756 length:225 start_codon:yes stop_codon:yes gene_type:complete